MPDYAAHYIFGEALFRAPQIRAAVGDEEALTAWRWGLQGPDPLFFRAAASLAGGAMHRGAPEGLFQAMLLHMAQLRVDARNTAGAWLCGFLAHYFLDRTVHPYVCARMGEMARRMPDASGNACHYQIETDMDIDLYFYRYRQPVSAFDPRRGMALSPWQKEVIAGMLAAGSFAKGVVLPVSEAVKALDSTAVAQGFIFRGGGLVWSAARGLELLLGKNRQLTGHVKYRQPRWDSLNLGRAPWIDPRDGATRTQSVPDLMEQAERETLSGLERLAPLLEGDGQGQLNLDGIDFSGWKAAEE